MEVLQSSLMRTDTSAEAFDLPAYGELLMLYGVATDLATSLNFTSYRNNTRVQAFGWRADGFPDFGTPVADGPYSLPTV